MDVPPEIDPDPSDTSPHDASRSAAFLRRKAGSFRGFVSEELRKVPLGQLMAKGTPLGVGGGRGQVVRLDLEVADAPARPLRLVARDYRRGGLASRLLPDWFAGPGRALAEVAVMRDLERKRVPTLQVMGAVWRSCLGLVRLRLLTRFEEGAVPLPAALAKPGIVGAADPAELAGPTASTLSQAFSVGLLHRDLHPDNLLVRPRSGATDRPTVLVLDLDGCRIAGGPTASSSRDAMLVRLARYWVKHRARLGTGPDPAWCTQFLSELDPERDPRSWAVALAGQLVEQCRRRARRFGLTDSDLERIEAYAARVG